MPRPLDRHLDADELDALLASQVPVAPAGQLSEDVVREAQRHVDACQDCDRKVQMHRSAQSAISLRAVNEKAAKGPNCSDEIEWLKLAAERLDQDEAEERMKHASQCGYCGPLLKAAVKCLSDEVTPDEEAALAKLASAQSDWQAKMARTLRAVGEPHRPQQPTFSFWKSLLSRPRAAFAVVGLAVLLVAFWTGLRYLHQQSTEQLLAQAYSEQRTLELRIPGAAYGPMRVELGPQQSHSERPATLLKAETLIAENLKVRPDDARWLYAKGEADLLEADFESARKNLEEALRRAPGDENVQLALATAHFSLSNYSEALNLLRAITHDHPTNAPAWFNLAITCAKLHLFTEALSAWNSYLALDPSSPWAAEAQKRKHEIEQIINDSHARQSRRTYDPAEFRGLSESERAALDDKVEVYLNAAVSSWLPNVARDSAHTGPELEAAKTIAELAAERHQDDWLNEVLGSVDNRLESEGITSLAEAVKDSEAGDYSRASEAAQHSTVNFERARLMAGILRARFETVYAHHLSENGEACFAEAETLLQQLRGRPYSWLEIQTELERAICANMTGRMREAKAGADRALHLAHTYNYGGLYLRATSLAAVLEWTTGNFRAATKLANDGLDTYWSRSYPPMAGYNLYAVLDSVAQDSEQWFSQVSTGREALHLIAADPDHNMKAVMYQTLANAAVSSGEVEIANANFQEALHELSLSPSGEASATLRAVTRVGIARMEYLDGKPQEAVTLLNEIEPFLEGASNRFVLLDLYLTRGDAYAAAGNRQEAKVAFARAVEVCEKSLNSFDNERERLIWTRLYDRSYRAFVALALQDDPKIAFQLWEWYKSAPLGRIVRTGEALRTASTETIVGHRAKSGQAQLPPAPRDNTVVISFMLSDKSIGAWVYTSKDIEYRQLPSTPQSLVNLAMTFSENCRNPNSSQSSLRDDGRRLYDILIRPFSARIRESDRLIIETDGVLDGIPLEALVDPHGNYLEDIHDIGVSPGLLYLSRTRPSITSIDKTEALVVGNPSVVDLSHLGLNPIPRADEEAKQVGRLLPHSRILMGPDATMSALLEGLKGVDIFHFSGHALLVGNGSGLVTAAGAGEHRSALLDASQLEPRRLKRTSLVVLSACSTAGSNDQALTEENSLARTFINFGVPQVIASRWPVDSEATTDLMELFYQQLARGKSVASALREAKLAVRGKKDYSHPYYWAAFSLFGTA